MLSVYYLTYACNFRCPYCSDGTGKPYYKLSSPVLPGQSVISLLKIIRRHCDYIVITGGEPLRHPDFSYVMDNLGKLKFKNVILTTNGYDLDSCLTSVAPAVHSLVFSIDTLDHEKADQYYGIGQGAFQNILYNVEQAGNLKKRKYEIIISSVITPDNIDDLYNVYEYSKDRGFIFAACPQLVGVRAHHSLAGDPDYQRFFDFLISEKKKGNKINGTVLYLEYMRDLKKFSCSPFTMLVVSPVGQVFYPCLEIGNLTGSLFDNDSLHNLRQKGCKQFGPQPECGNQCHSACALGFSLILNYPLSILHEIFLGILYLVRKAVDTFKGVPK